MGREIHGVVTQGRDDCFYAQWIPSYNVEVYQSGSWVQVTNEAGSYTFTGNTDCHTQVWQRFSNPVTTQKVRFFPLSWNEHISMRAGLLLLVPYGLMNTALSWSDANAACLAAGMQLASVKSAA